MFTIKSELVLGILAAFIVGITLYFIRATPVRTVEGNNDIPTKTSLGFVSTPSEAKRTLTVKTTKALPPNSVLSIDFNGNVMSERPEQTAARKELGVSAEVVVRRDFFDPARDFPFDDFGTFAAFNPAGKDFSDSLVVGLRASPFRLYDIVAPDFLLSFNDIGLGVSFYAPPDLFGSKFSHWGLGYGRIWSFRYGGEANIFYLGFSTKDL